MGWWGHYVGGKAPTGKERIELALRENGFIAKHMEENGTTWDVLETAIRGTVVYAAIRVRREDYDKTHAAVYLTRFEKDGYLMVKSMSEDMGPCEANCPKKILDLLSPTDSEFAKDWRERCRQNLRQDEIGKLPLGTKLKVNINGVCYIAEICKYRGRRSYINWAQMIRFKPWHFRHYGYEIV